MNFVAALRQHSVDQTPHGNGQGSDDRRYWVCAYANNQHDLEAEISEDPKETSFFKAMQLSEGVLIVPAAV